MTTTPKHDPFSARHNLPRSTVRGGSAGGDEDPAVARKPAIRSPPQFKPLVLENAAVPRKEERGLAHQQTHQQHLQPHASHQPLQQPPQHLYQPLQQSHPHPSHHLSQSQAPFPSRRPLQDRDDAQLHSSNHAHSSSAAPGGGGSNGAFGDATGRRPPSGAVATSNNVVAARSREPSITESTTTFAPHPHPNPQRAPSPSGAAHHGTSQGSDPLAKLTKPVEVL